MRSSAFPSPDLVRQDSYECATHVGSCGRHRISSQLAVVLLLAAAIHVVAQHGGMRVLHAGDVAALQVLKELLRSSNTTYAGWSSSDDTDPCVWEGITCRDRRVTSLQLPCLAGTCSHPIHGPLLHILASLSALQVLSLRNIQLTGSLPTQVAGWSSLVLLDLHGNQLEGTLPPEWGQQLTQLEYLDLGHNMLTGTLPWEWSEMQNLKRLDVGNNELEGSVPLSWTAYGNSGMRSMQDLVLADNCGLCGGLPLFHGTRVDTRNTSLSENCGMSGRGDCKSSYSYSNLMIALAILMGSFAVCALQRRICWRWRTDIGALWPPDSGDNNAERGQAGAGHNGRHQQVSQIRSFEAFVELYDPSVKSWRTTNSSRHNGNIGSSNQPVETHIVGPSVMATDGPCASNTGPGTGGALAGDPASSDDSAHSGALQPASTAVSVDVATSAFMPVHPPPMLSEPCSAHPHCPVSDVARDPRPTAPSEHVSSTVLREPQEQQAHRGPCGSITQQQRECHIVAVCPSVILMPDGHHLALAIPEPQQALTATCSSNNCSCSIDMGDGPPSNGNGEGSIQHESGTGSGSTSQQGGLSIPTQQQQQQQQQAAAPVASRLQAVRQLACQVGRWLQRVVVLVEPVLQVDVHNAQNGNVLGGIV